MRKGMQFSRSLLQNCKFLYLNQRLSKRVNDVRSLALHTGDVGFSNPLEDVNVEYRTQHSLQDADLRTETQREQHGEEEHRPEGSTRQLHDGLGEDDEGKPGALGSLLVEK